MSKQKISYPARCERFLTKMVTRLLSKPEKYQRKLGLRLLQHEYINPVQRENVSEALILWEVLDPGSDFYTRIFYRQCESEFAESTAFNEAVRAMVLDQKRRLKPFLEERLDNHYLKAVILINELPCEVFRKCLWYYNIDFQSKESFLRRLTEEQINALYNHWQMLKNGTPKEKLPCFSEGWINKVWQFFDLPYWFGEKMEAKSALAYDFGNANIGFQLYPNTENDQQADQILANQFFDSASMSEAFLSLLGFKSSEVKTEDSKPKGSFQVNQECGMYWFLYRTMFSNRFYNKDKSVCLGKRICPGVWATFFFWTFLLVVSPLCFIVSLSQSIFTDNVSFIGTLIGTVSPTVFGLYYLLTRFDKYYDEEYSILLFVCAVVLALVLTFSWIIETIGRYSGIAILLYLAILLILPYCIKHKTLNFWKTPLVGKILPIVFLTSISWDYISIFMDLALKIVGMIFAFIWLNFWKLIFWLVISDYIFIFGFTALLIYISIYLFKKLEAVYENKLMQNSKDIKGFIYLVQSLSFSFLTITFLALSGFFETGNFDIWGRNVYGFSLERSNNLLVLMQGFIVFYVTMITFSIFFFRTISLTPHVMLTNNFFKMRGVACSDELKCYKSRLKGIIASLQKNQFFNEIDFPYEIKSNYISAILGVAVDNKDMRGWIELGIKKISNLNELANFKIFITDELRRRRLPNEVDERIIDLILTGQYEFTNKYLPKSQKISVTKGFVDFVKKTKSRLLEKIKQFFRPILKVINDIWYFLRGLSKFCPQSPSGEYKRIR